MKSIKYNTPHEIHELNQNTKEIKEITRNSRTSPGNTRKSTGNPWTQPGNQGYNHDINRKSRKQPGNPGIAGLFVNVCYLLFLWFWLFEYKNTYGYLWIVDQQERTPEIRALHVFMWKCILYVSCDYNCLNMKTHMVICESGSSKRRPRKLMNCMFFCERVCFLFCGFDRSNMKTHMVICEM